jgi:hypothetical protein
MKAYRLVLVYIMFKSKWTTFSVHIIGHGCIVALFNLLFIDLENIYHVIMERLISFPKHVVCCYSKSSNLVQCYTMGASLSIPMLKLETSPLL